jgi:hypothetical protein
MKEISFFMGRKIIDRTTFSQSKGRSFGKKLKVWKEKALGIRHLVRWLPKIVCWLNLTEPLRVTMDIEFNINAGSYVPGRH